MLVIFLHRRSCPDRAGQGYRSAWDDILHVNCLVVHMIRYAMYIFESGPVISAATCLYQIESTYQLSQPVAGL